MNHNLIIKSLLLSNVELNHMKTADIQGKNETLIGEDVYRMRSWDFKEDREDVSKLLDIVFEKELESKGITVRALFDEYKSMMPLLKLLGIFNKNFRHTLDGFVFENEQNEVIASVNIGYGISHWEIAMVATHPDHRRKGLAKKLVTQAINHAKNLGAKMCILEVRDMNEPAYNLYKKLGFVHYDSVTRLKYTPEKLQELSNNLEIPSKYNMGELNRNKTTNQERYELTLRTTPEEVQNFHPISRKRFHSPLLIRIIRPIAGLLLNVKPNAWLVYLEDELIATMNIFLSRKEGSNHRLDIKMDSKHTEILFESLLNFGLHFVKKNYTIEQNTVVELRSSDEKQMEICKEYSFEEIETMHLLGLKFEEQDED